MSTDGLDRALELKRSGQLDEAVIAIEAVLARFPSSVAALTQLADTQLRRRRTGEAAMAIDRAESIAGTTALTAKLRGDLNYHQQRWKEAARSYQEADALGDKATWTLVQLARCHLRLRDVEAAKGAAARAAERDPQSASAWVVLGEVALREGRLDEAIERFERANQRAPADQYAYSKLVEARLLRLEPDQRAREVAILLRTKGKGNRHLMGVLAKLQSDSGDAGKAAATWRARREEHGDLWSRKMEGFTLRKAGQLAEAAGVMRACLMEDPSDVVLFKIYVRTERERGALDDLRSALEQLVLVAGARQGAVYAELRKLGPAG